MQWGSTQEFVILQYYTHVQDYQIMFFNIERVIAKIKRQMYGSFEILSTQNLIHHLIIQATLLHVSSVWSMQKLV